MVNANNNLSKLKSIARSEADVNFDKRTDFFLDALAIDAKQNCSKKEKIKQASPINAAKCAKLFNKIFDYIYVS